jgi:hypothetical protein
MVSNTRLQCKAALLAKSAAATVGEAHGHEEENEDAILQDGDTKEHHHGDDEGDKVDDTNHQGDEEADLGDKEKGQFTDDNTKEGDKVKPHQGNNEVAGGDDDDTNHQGDNEVDQGDKEKAHLQMMIPRKVTR